MRKCDKQFLMALCAIAIGAFPFLPLLAADNAVVAANVLTSANGNVTRGTAGATITAGQVLAKVSGSLVLASATSTTANNVAGIAVNGAAAGQPVLYVTADPNFVFGTTGSAGMVYYMSPNNPGGITGTFGDLTSGDTCIILGACNLTGGSGTATLNFSPITGGTHS